MLASSRCSASGPKAWSSTCSIASRIRPLAGVALVRVVAEVGGLERAAHDLRDREHADDLARVLDQAREQAGEVVAPRAGEEVVELVRRARAGTSTGGAAPGSRGRAPGTARGRSAASTRSATRAPSGGGVRLDLRRAHGAAHDRGQRTAAEHRDVSHESSKRTAMMTDRGPPTMTGAPVAIDARAAARPELGGVERWARELARRLPALRPGGYVVLRPPAALAHRAGHAWEQLVLPVRASRLGARALLCPANLAPLAYGRSVVVIHDAAPLRHPGWYSRAYVAWQRLALPAIARRAWRVVTVSEFARARAGGAARGRGGRGRRAASTSASRPRPTPSRRGAPSPRPPVRPLRRLPHGAQEPRRARAGRARAGRRRHRRRRRRRPPAAVRAPSSGLDAPAAARPRRRRAAARPVRRRRGVRPAVALRGLRAAGARGDGVRHAGRGRRRRRAAGDVRRRRPARRARRRGVRGRAHRPARRRAPRGSGCAPPASQRAAGVHLGRAPRARSTRCSATAQPRCRRLAGTPRSAHGRADAPAPCAHAAPQAGAAERRTRSVLRSADSHVYQ